MIFIVIVCHSIENHHAAVSMMVFVRSRRTGQSAPAKAAAESDYCFTTVRVLGTAARFSVTL